LIKLYISDYATNEIVNIRMSQLDEIQKLGAQNSSDNLNNTMTVDPITDTHLATFLGDENLTQETNMTSPHLEGVPHTHIVTLPTLSPHT
jgi:hypothetical protein